MEPNRKRALFALVAIAVLAAIGWFVVDRLVSDEQLQDCLMSGRKNCAPIEEGSR